MPGTDREPIRDATAADLERARQWCEDDGLAIVEGELAVSRAAASPWRLRGVLATPSRWTRLSGVVDPTIERRRAPHEALREVVGFDFHRGCLAWVEREPPRRERSATEDHGALLVVAALGLADPANLGALVRNARAFGVDELWIDRRGADPLSRRAIRASAGWVFDLPWRWVDGGAEVIMRTAHARAALVATTPRPDATALALARRPERAVICFGSEGPGLDDRLIDVASLTVRVELAPGVDSLNVAATSAVVLHAMTRR